jgi:signal transduction histidine kinase
MKPPKRTFKMLSDTTLRRLRSTPSYFFLMWRWSMWLYALVLIVGSRGAYTQTVAYRISVVFLFITLAQTLIVTLYAPVVQILVPRINALPFLRRLQAGKRLSLQAEEEDTGILTPLTHVRNPYWNIAMYGLDVVICGLATYLTGPFGLAPSFGSSSPFYRYGMSTAFAAALAYRYPGAFAAAIGYDLFILLGIFYPPSLPPSGQLYTPNVIDIAGSLVDTPVAALCAAFVVTLLASLTHSKRQLQADVRRQRVLLDVGDTIVREASDWQRLLQKSAEQLCKGGPFQRLIVALITNHHEETDQQRSLVPIDTLLENLIEIDHSNGLLPARSNMPLEYVIRTGERYIDSTALHTPAYYDYKMVQLYQPIIREGQVRMILGVESLRMTSFDYRQINFLTIAGTQLLIALENIRLTEQMIHLAATAERGRIAREIHDGVAQLVYMLSLNAETCATQAHRIVEASDEDAEVIEPLAARLDKMVTISKQALWETRNYMFSLKPLMTGHTTLAQMLTNQVREFETISDLPVHLEIIGSEAERDANGRDGHTAAQVGTAIFRIVQEALTNAYKHASATALHISLHYLPDSIEVEIRDNGRGLPAPNDESTTEANEKRSSLYSGRGIVGMRERAAELGGILEVVPIPDGGVKIWARIPFAQLRGPVLP